MIRFYSLTTSILFYLIFWLIFCNSTPSLFTIFSFFITITTLMLTFKTPATNSIIIFLKPRFWLYIITLLYQILKSSTILCVMLYTNRSFKPIIATYLLSPSIANNPHKLHLIITSITLTPGSFTADIEKTSLTTTLQIHSMHENFFNTKHMKILANQIEKI